MGELRDKLYKVNNEKSTAYGQYYGRVAVLSTLNEVELGDLVAADSGVERSKVGVVMDAVFKQMKELLLNGHSIKVGELGTFRVFAKSKGAETVKKFNCNEHIKGLIIRLKEKEEIRNAAKATKLRRNEGYDRLPAEGLFSHL